MKKTIIIRIFLVAGLAVGLAGCGGTGGGSGFDGGMASLNWNPPTTNSDGTPLKDLAGYKIYYGTSSGRYPNNIDVGNTTAYTVTKLPVGTINYFSVTAYDSSGNESSFSNEVSKTL